MTSISITSVCVECEDDNKTRRADRIITIFLVLKVFMNMKSLNNEVRMNGGQITKKILKLYPRSKSCIANVLINMEDKGQLETEGSYEKGKSLYRRLGKNGHNCYECLLRQNPELLENYLDSY